MTVLPSSLPSLTLPPPLSQKPGMPILGSLMLLWPGWLCPPPSSSAVSLTYTPYTQHTPCSFISLFPSQLLMDYTILILVSFLASCSCFKTILWLLEAHKDEWESPSTWFIKNCCNDWHWQYLLSSCRNYLCSSSTIPSFPMLTKINEIWMLYEYKIFPDFCYIICCNINCESEKLYHS